MHTGAKKKINLTQIFLYCHLGKTQASSSSCSCEGELAEQDTHQVLAIVVAIVNIVFLSTSFKIISATKYFLPNYCILLRSPSESSQTAANGGWRRHFSVKTWIAADIRFIHCQTFHSLRQF